MEENEMAHSEDEVFFVAKAARERLKNHAQAATAGPWLVWDDGDVGTAYAVERTTRRGLTRIESKHIANCSEPDAAYIALADPQTVLLLISQLESLEERLAQFEAVTTEKVPKTYPA